MVRHLTGFFGLVRYKVPRENHIQGSPVGGRFVHRAIWWQCLTAEQKFAPLSWFYCRTWFGNHPLESSLAALQMFMEKKKKAWLINFDRYILESETVGGRGGGYWSHFPALFSRESRIPNFSHHYHDYRFLSDPAPEPKIPIDQHSSKRLISLVPVTCTTFCFQG